MPRGLPRACTSWKRQTCTENWWVSYRLVTCNYLRGFRLHLAPSIALIVNPPEILQIFNMSECDRELREDSLFCFSSRRDKIRSIGFRGESGMERNLQLTFVAANDLCPLFIVCCFGVCDRRILLIRRIIFRRIEPDNGVAMKCLR